MKQSIKVYLGDGARLVATLRYDQQGARESAAFEYDPIWLTAANRFAIDPALPLVAGPQFKPKSALGSVFHGAIADTEPDGWARRVILRDHAKRRQAARDSGYKNIETRPLNALDFLLAVDDTSRIGALRFQDASGVFQRQLQDGRRTAPPMVELGRLVSASHAVETDSETEADLEYLRGRATSLGGLRPKCTIIDEAGRLAIGKFPSVTDERAVTKGEVLAMRLAKHAGINAADARIVDSDGIPVTVITRFDRAQDGGRIMYVSAETMLGASESDGIEHTYTEIVDVLRSKGAATQADIEELWRRIAFSILITNVDDHLRNHGFLHVAHDQWRLAPAFDLNPFPNRIRELKTWISEETGPAASIDAAMSVIPYFRISLKRAYELLDPIERAVSRWQEEGRSLGMTNSDLEQFSLAFEHQERIAVREVIAKRTLRL